MKAGNFHYRKIKINKNYVQILKNASWRRAAGGGGSRRRRQRAAGGGRRNFTLSCTFLWFLLLETLEEATTLTQTARAAAAATAAAAAAAAAAAGRSASRSVTPPLSLRTSCSFKCKERVKYTSQLETLIFMLYRKEWVK